MSGSAGGVTINKEDLKLTIRDYRENVLKPLNLHKSYNITGVRRRPEKNVFGDIDIVISFPGGDKKELKQKFAQHLEQIDKIPTIPHKKNLKYFIHGSIVTTLYPISNKPGQYVQIDNIITASEDEGKFTYSMLDLPAQEQGLALGLAKTIFTELNPIQLKQLFKDLNISQDIELPSEGEEYDFNLNTSELSLRIVPIGQNSGREIWKTTKFNDIKILLKSLGIDIEKDKFDDIIQVIKKFKNRRSIDRLKGMFIRNIRVGDAEVGRDKGIAKQKSIDTVAALEEKYNSLVISLITPIILEAQDKPSIAIFPGKFKPPHKDHLARIQAASRAVGPLGTVKVLISPKPTTPDPNQETITAEQSLAIFNLYQNKGLIPDNVEFQISPDSSPVLSAYKEFEKNQYKTPEDQQPYIAVFGKEEAKRFSDIYKIPNITINDFPEANIGNESATNVRIALKNNNDLSKYLPKEITPEEYKQALNIPLTINKLNVQSVIKEDIQQIELPPSTENIFLPYVKSLTKYMIDNGLEIQPLPKVKFIDDDVANADDFFGKTAYYDPNQKIIALYTLRRHPKDIMRSFAHEMIHHKQNLEGRLCNISTQNTNEGGDLPELEREAYEKGNMFFRNWEDTIKNPPQTISLNEGRYDKISNVISSTILKKWKEDFQDGKKVGSYQDYIQTNTFDFKIDARIVFSDEDDKLDIDGNILEKNDETILEVFFKVPKNNLPQEWSSISMGLKDLIRHEIEHLTQSDEENYPSKFLPDDQLIRDLIGAKLLPTSQYFKLEKEIDANLQGMYFRAKKEKRPFADVINDYINTQDISPQQKKEIIDIWRNRAKALSLPKF